jgi:hypothetical protein
MLLSLTVVRKKKNARSVKAALKVHGARIAEKLDGVFAAIRHGGQPAVDYFGLMSDLENGLDVALADLERADWSHLAEAANDRRLRRRRDVLTGKLYRTLTRVSGNADNTYARGTAEEVLGLGSGLRPRAEMLIEVGSRVSATLAAPGFGFPEPELGGSILDPVEIRREVDGPLDDLVTVMTALDDEKKKFDVTLAAKQRAVEDFDKVYSCTTFILRDLFVLAGEERLAERIRPTVRKRQRSTSAPG